MFKDVTIRRKGAAGTLVVGYTKDAPLDGAVAADDAQGAVAAAHARPESTGEVGCVTVAYPADAQPAARVLLVGLGQADAMTTDTLRTAAGVAGRRLAEAQETSVRFEVGDALDRAGIGPDDGLCAIGEGIGLVGWTCDSFRGSATTTPKRAKLAIVAGSAAAEKPLRHGLGLAEGANLARTLSQTPPNVATPLWMAEQARSLVSLGLRVRVIKGAALERERLAGHVNVGKASDHEPCLIRVEYTPEKPRRGAKPIVLVGKTITYDTGGLSLKVNNGMRGMKRDKDGGCAVLGAMRAIASTIKPRVPVVALLCAAENSISDEAYRPDDVLTFRNGKTVEVTNTDAEGRLVLADGLCWAFEKEKPACVIDVATLTGGVVVALGSTYAGLWCEDEGLRAKLDHAAQATGERLWRLPLHQEYRDMLKSEVADLINSNPNRKAHPIQGAAFLSAFTTDDAPWAHIDIAGVHAVEGDQGPYIAGPTGFGARLLARLVENW